MSKIKFKSDDEYLTHFEGLIDSLRHIARDYGYCAYGLSYKDYSGIDVINNPDLASRPDIAIDISGWFWSVRYKLNPIADSNNITSITKKINGGLTNFSERVKQLNYYNSIDTLGILKKKASPRPVKSKNKSVYSYYNPFTRVLDFGSKTK